MDCLLSRYPSVYHSNSANREETTNKLLHNLGAQNFLLIYQRRKCCRDFESSQFVWTTSMIWEEQELEYDDNKDDGDERWIRSKKRR